MEFLHFLSTTEYSFAHRLAGMSIWLFDAVTSSHGMASGLSANADRESASSRALFVRHESSMRTSIDAPTKLHEVRSSPPSGPGSTSKDSIDGWEPAFCQLHRASLAEFSLHCGIVREEFAEKGGPEDCRRGRAVVRLPPLVQCCPERARKHGIGNKQARHAHQ